MLGLFKVRLFQSIVEADYDPTVAEEKLDYLVESDRDDAAALAFRADLYFNQGAIEAALTKYDEAIARDESFAHAHLGKGNIHDLRGEREQALATYSKAAKLAPSNQVYLNNVAYQLFRLGRYRSAIAKYGELQPLDWRYMLPYYVAAAAYRLVGDLATSQAYQEELLKLLSDRQARSLTRNKQLWFFHTASPESAPTVSFLAGYAAKTYYARLSLALTAYLRDDERRSRAEVARARRLVLDPDDREAALRIVR